MEAQIKRAEGNKQAQILDAEGQAQARIAVASAEATAIERVTKALGSTGATDPAQYLIAIHYLDSFKELSAGQDNKMIYMPYEATAALGSLGAIKGLFEKEGLPVAALAPKSVQAARPAKKKEQRPEED